MFGCAGSSLLGGLSLVEHVEATLPLSGCSAWASHCGGLLAVEHGLQSTVSLVVAHALSCSVACGNLPGSGTEPVSPALAGGFFTTEPEGKP